MNGRPAFDAVAQKVSLCGELGIYTVAEIRRQLLDAMAKSDAIEVDLAGVTEIDTAGLQLMLLAKRKPGKAVTFTHHPAEVLRLVDLANVGLMLGDPVVIGANNDSGGLSDETGK